MGRGSIGRETQVKLTRCRALTFSVVIFADPNAVGGRSRTVNRLHHAFTAGRHDPVSLAHELFGVGQGRPVDGLHQVCRSARLFAGFLGGRLARRWARRPAPQLQFATINQLDPPPMQRIFYRLKTGCQWALLPAGSGSKSAVRETFQRWAGAGVFAELFRLGADDCEELIGFAWACQTPPARTPRRRPSSSARRYCCSGNRSNGLTTPMGPRFSTWV